MTRFHCGRNIGCLPSRPYHWSCMSDQLLMWHNAAYSVYYAQRQVSASLWNAKAFSRSTYIKSVYKHYAVADMKLQSWHKGDCTASAHHHSLWQTAQCECQPVRGSQAVVAYLRDCPLTWRRNTQIQLYWLWNWLESYNNCTFSTWKDKFYSICYFGSLIRFVHFMIMLGEELPSLPPLTARHWFFIIQIFEQLSFSEKQSCPETFHCVEIFFIFQNFWALVACPEKQSVPWFHCFEYIYIFNHSEF